MKIQSINPATEEVIGEVEVSEKKDVSKAVKSARKAFKNWKSVDISEKSELIKNIAKLMKERKKELSELITKEMGKPIFESEGEIDETVGEIEWFANESKKYIEDDILDLGLPETNAKIVFEAIGVAGVITPWNYPINNPMWKIIPALITGNTIVFKPSELSSLCGKEIENLIKDAGIPAGVFNIIYGDEAVGKHLVNSNVDMISLTGSSETGKFVASKAGKKLKRTVLELGGSDPFIVLEDAIFEQVVNGAVYGRLVNCGQVCTSAKRIFVAEKIFDEFVNQFVEKTKKLKVGNGLEPDTDIGPIISKEQLEKVENQVKDAADKGAKILCGGKRPESLSKGYFYLPTVLINVNNKMKVLKEEVFGPVAPIVKFKNIKEAIKLANKTKYGLGASIWTSDVNKGGDIARRLECGMVWINDVGTPYPQCPWGGVKESGIGRELSKYGILDFVNIKSVITTTSKDRKRAWWLPYNK